MTVAIQAGLAMTLLQLGIGSTNDVVDAPRDAGLKPGKPIPAGFVGRRAAIVVAAACFGGGLVLAAAIGAWVGLLAIVVIAIGLAYDLRLKGTAWSWLPFAIGIPILPMFGWAAAARPLPAAFLVLVPAAVAGGAALAIGNALVDLERDRAAGVTSIAATLGVERATATATTLFVAIWAAAVGSALAAAGASLAVALIGGAGAVPVVSAVAARQRGPTGRERAWRAESIGLAIVLTVWVAVVLGAR